MSTTVAGVDGAAIRARWPLRSPSGESDKEDRGQIVVVGGAASTPGAVLLAGIAALRVGAGKLTIATSAATAPMLAVAVPEAGVIGVETTPDGAFRPAAASYLAELAADADAVLIGPGMCGPTETKDVIDGLLPRLTPRTLVVLDALAVSCGAVGTSPDGGASRVVITPNRSEAEYLVDDQAPDAELSVMLATRYGVTVVLGSHVASPDGASWRVAKGNAGLATSGSGDVLAGAVAGVAARDANPLKAALWGLLLHGAAGDRLAARVGPVGFLARELLDELPGCLRDLSN